MEVIKKGVYNSKALTFDVSNVRIINVIVPKSEGNREKFKTMAKKVIKKCGIRTSITYYPIPPEIAIKKEMVPYYFLCLARCREEKMREGG
ncbi:MAG: hypothetical protein VR68_08695 [Peptococcaceae bacterium BRH_c4a]|nr:MAG: hypothetical protein VR68_08695 [Peptococcaceae bacterium BRH_c4a]